METQFTTPVSRTNLRYTQLIEAFSAAASQKADVMPARFKVSHVTDAMRLI